MFFFLFLTPAVKVSDDSGYWNTFRLFGEVMFAVLQFGAGRKHAVHAE